MGGSSVLAGDARREACCKFNVLAEDVPFRRRISKTCAPAENDLLYVVRRRRRTPPVRALASRLCDSLPRFQVPHPSICKAVAERRERNIPAPDKKEEDR